jgi:hypothetical protein
VRWRPDDGLLAGYAIGDHADERADEQPEHAGDDCSDCMRVSQIHLGFRPYRLGVHRGARGAEREISTTVSEVGTTDSLQLRRRRPDGASFQTTISNGLNALSAISLYVGIRVRGEAASGGRRSDQAELRHRSSR